MSMAKAIVCPPADSHRPASALTPMSVPVLARQRSCAAVPRMRLRIVPVRPATASDPSNAPATSWPCIASSRCTTWRGVVRSARESPEPSTTCGVRPKARELGPDDADARGGRAGAAELGAEVLEQHLGQEVVGRDVGQADEVAHRRRGDGGQLLRLGRRGARAAAPLDADAVGRAGPSRTAPRPAAAGRPSFEKPAVEGQRAQDAADVAVVGAAGVEGAAQEVEARLVAEDRPVDAQDPGRADRARQALQVVAAERRVAAAAQVEVAAPDAVGVEEPSPGDRGGQRRVGPEAHQGGGRRVELLHRGGRARRVGLWRRTACAGCRDRARRRPRSRPRGASRA